MAAKGPASHIRVTQSSIELHHASETADSACDDLEKLKSQYHEVRRDCRRERAAEAAIEAYLQAIVGQLSPDGISPDPI